MAEYGHIYDASYTGKGRWFCMMCKEDCGHDDLPCSCCMDDLPAVYLYSDGVRMGGQQTKGYT